MILYQKPEAGKLLWKAESDFLEALFVVNIIHI